MSEHILYAPIQINRGTNKPALNSLLEGELFSYPSENSFVSSLEQPMHLMIGGKIGSNAVMNKELEVKYAEIATLSYQTNKVESVDVKINGNSYGVENVQGNKDASDDSIEFSKYLASIGAIRILKDTKGYTHFYSRDPSIDWSNVDKGTEPKSTLNDFIIKRSRFEKCWLNNVNWIRGKKGRFWGTTPPTDYVEDGQLFFVVDEST